MIFRFNMHNSKSKWKQIPIDFGNNKYNMNNGEPTQRYFSWHKRASNNSWNHNKNRSQRVSRGASRMKLMWGINFACIDDSVWRNVCGIQFRRIECVKESERERENETEGPSWHSRAFEREKKSAFIPLMLSMKFKTITGIKKHYRQNRGRQKTKRQWQSGFDIFSSCRIWHHELSAANSLASHPTI